MLERIRKAQKDEGFTLIELLIVIVILGILAAIVVFAIGSTRKDSVSSSCKTDFKSIQLSAEAVNTKTGSYPAVVAGGATDDATYVNLLSSGGKGGLLAHWPSSSDYAFAYDPSAPAGGYTITISGSNVVGGAVTSADAASVLTAKCAGK